MKLVNALLLLLSLFLTSGSAAASPDDASASEEDHQLQLCSLCGAEAMPQVKLDMVLLDRMIVSDEEDDETTVIPTCADFEFFEIQNGGASEESCADLQDKYARACCSPDFDEIPELLPEEDLEEAAEEEEQAEEEVEEPAYLRRHREMAWTVVGRSRRPVGNARTGHNNGRVAQRRPATTTAARRSGGGGSAWCRDNRYASNSVRFATPGGACKCPVCPDGRTPTAARGGSIHVPGRGNFVGKTCKQLDGIGQAGQLTNGFCVPFQRANAACCQASNLGFRVRGNGRE